jgi:spermidine synthase
MSTKAADVKILEQEGFHFLWIDGDLWMSDINSEIQLQNNLARQAYGHVLVAGYGLGVCHKALCINSKVISVSTVELHKAVVSQCLEIFGEVRGSIFIADFFDSSRDHELIPYKGLYDCIIGDLWPEITPDYLSDYIKFKKRAEELVQPDGRILAWGGDYFEYLIKTGEEPI